MLLACVLRYHFISRLTRSHLRSSVFGNLLALPYPTCSSWTGLQVICNKTDSVPPAVADGQSNPSAAIEYFLDINRQASPSRIFATGRASDRDASSSPRLHLHGHNWSLNHRLTKNSTVKRSLGLHLPQLTDNMSALAVSTVPSVECFGKEAYPKDSSRGAYGNNRTNERASPNTSRLPATSD